MYLFIDHIFPEENEEDLTLFKKFQLSQATEKWQDKETRKNLNHFVMYIITLKLIQLKHEFVLQLLLLHSITKEWIAF